MVYIEKIKRVRHTKEKNPTYTKNNIKENEEYKGSKYNDVTVMYRPKTRMQRLKERKEHNELMRRNKIRSLACTFLKWRVGMKLIDGD